METDGNKKKKKTVRKSKYVTQACLLCNTEFEVLSGFAKWRKFCSNICAYTYNNSKLKQCPHCGKLIPRGKRGGKRR